MDHVDKIESFWMLKTDVTSSFDGHGEIKLNKNRLAISLTLTRHTLMSEKLPRDHGDL